MPAPAIVRSASAGLERLLDRVLCVFGAVLFSQLPEFIQQYTQRLEGHLDEARLQIEKFKEAAAQMGMTLDQLVAGSAQGPGAAGQLSAVVRSSVARVDKLASADAALRQASAWTRPFQFVAHLDLPIARATWDIFRPAVPVTAEGLVYALTGMIAALAAYHLLVRMPISGAMRRRRLAKAAVQA